MRFFISLRYLGTHYFGWQRQPNQISVQETIEKALSILLKTPTEIVGCGRTDTGVHARFYVAHFDFFEENLPEKFQHSFNSLLPNDIAILDFWQVADDAHARFDAVERGYEYHISLKKDPFLRELAWQNPLAQRADLVKMNAAAQILLDFSEFKPFCKTNGSATTSTCKIIRADWVFDKKNDALIFHIFANRFLRGMVRLLVGMCLEVGFGKLSLEEVRTTLETQKPLRRSVSVPATGLFLTQVLY
jgi:tRNA pseudouridine38-40 synthase